MAISNSNVYRWETVDIQGFGPDAYRVMGAKDYNPIVLTGSDGTRAHLATVLQVSAVRLLRLQPLVGNP
jgi:hypothetical protein